MSAAAIILTPTEKALKLATLHAVEAAGGQVHVGRELGRAQSRISDYCSENTRDFIPAELIAPLETLGAGQPGHPHITRFLARQQEMPFGNLPIEPRRGRENLGDWFAAIARENADLAEALADQDLARSAGELPKSARDRISREADQLIAKLTGLRAAVDGAKPGRTRRADTS